ncbi:MAG TPA: CopD family protein [Burkholderiaceae bacterium]|nr:CopD family protein [Burkholderiaceae bacterium]
MRHALIFLHLVGVTIWIGGMFFAHFCLRPAAAQVLQPPQILPLMSAALRRFFRWVAFAIVLLWGTGLTQLLTVGFARAPWQWHAMMGIALVMTVIFAVIAHGIYPTMRNAVAGADWAGAAAAMGKIRKLVLVNLVLGFGTIGVASLT